MTATTRAMQAAAVTAAAEQAAWHLARPEPVPGDQRWRAQSLFTGAAGIALLHIERAHTGLASWQTAHAWITAAASAEISAAADSGLHFGATALSFTLHAAHADGTARYATALASLDRHVAALTHRRVDAAQARIDRGDPPAFAEYDLLHGLTGIGAHLLHNTPSSDALGRILGYLVRLTAPLRIDGDTLPGWWVGHDPQRTHSAGFPGGHANLGIAHGITGPLALLAHALRRGIVVDGHHEAIAAICAWLDTWRNDTGAAPAWPRWITREQLRTGRPSRPGPLRPSWCYGTPGIARAQQWPHSPPTTPPARTSPSTPSPAVSPTRPSSPASPTPASATAGPGYTRPPGTPPVTPAHRPSATPCHTSHTCLSGTATRDTATAQGSSKAMRASP